MFRAVRVSLRPALRISACKSRICRAFNLFAIDLDGVRMRVATDMRSGLEHRHLVMTVQAARHDVAGNAAANDGDLHGAGVGTRRASSKRGGNTRKSWITPNTSSSFKP